MTRPKPSAYAAACALFALCALLPAPSVWAQAPASPPGDDATDDTYDIDQMIDEPTAASTTAVPHSATPVATSQTNNQGNAQGATPTVTASVSAFPSSDVEDGTFTGEPAKFAEFGCPAKTDDLSKSYVICADASHGRLQHAAIFPSTGAVVLPNRSFIVRVLHPADERIAVQLTGNKGIYEPAVNQGGVGAARGAARGNITWVVSQWTLPPVLPPSAVVRVELRDFKDALLDSVTFDLVVEKTYSGALRVGIGAVGAGATNAEYTVVKSPGSSQGEIVGLPAAAANFELVVGYAPYLDRGGRPVTGCRGGWACFEPYIGIGVVSQANEGVDFFESLHLGAEWEAAPSFSVALTAVARRVDRLRPGLRVGGPANESDPLTSQRISFGAGLVFNVSPDFLKVAHSGAAALF